MANLRALARPAAWGLVGLAAATALAAWLAVCAAAELARGRERLLAGDPAVARSAFERARRWPRARKAARAGSCVAQAASGAVATEAVPLDELDAFAPEALLLASIGRGRLDAAAALTDLARRAGHPVALVYAAALALERGDAAQARALAAASPMASRGLGSRVERVLAAQDRGAATLLLDRRGELAATVSEAGVQPVAGAAFALAGLLERVEVPPGREAARLALDLDLSRLAREALGERRGSIVLIEPRTGALLAAVSDERTAATERAAALSQRREPASIAKLLTAAAAYRASLDADAEIKRMTCAGVERYGGKPLWCVFPAGPLAGLDHALAVSCNVAFANLGTRLGAKRLVDEYRHWGFGAGWGALAGTAGSLHTLPRTPRQLADLAVGLELVDVTPLHAAVLAAVVANDGRLAEPRLVTGACSPLGLTDAPLPLPSPAVVLEPGVARRLLRAMGAVAANGTGGGLAPPLFPVAIKTGTAAERGRGYHVNYIGAGPLPEAPVAFCVRVTHERSSPSVTTAAREVTRRLLTGLAERRAALESAAAAARARGSVSGIGPAPMRP